MIRYRMRQILNKFCLLLLSAILLSGCGHSVSSVIGPWNLYTAQRPSDTIWYDMRGHFQLPTYAYKTEVRRQIRFLQRHRAYLYRILANSAPYIYYIYHETRTHNMPAEVALIPFVESEYYPFAYSHAGALGLWQMMPGTASGLGTKINWWYDGRRDVVDSTRVALKYIHYLNHYFDNNWLLTFAAYDAGEGTVLHAMRRHHARTFWYLGLPRETKKYIPKLLALAAVIKNPNYYHIKLPPISNQPYLAKVKLNSQIDLSQAARLAGMSPKALRYLNPGYRRWATEPKGHARLLLPLDRVDLFKKNLAKLPKKQKVSWEHHTVKVNETLSMIAHHYQTKINILARANHLRSHQLRVGQKLIVPRRYYGKALSVVSKKPVKIRADKLPGPQQKVHKVKRGESVGSIAKKYNVTPRQIRFWNNLEPQQKLLRKQNLVIWRSAKNKSNRIRKSNRYNA